QIVEYVVSRSVGFARFDRSGLGVYMSGNLLFSLDQKRLNAARDQSLSYFHRIAVPFIVSFRGAELFNKSVQTFYISGLDDLPHFRAELFKIKRFRVDIRPLID